MHFKSLELYGFKSFAEKTKLEFEPGITAIVGPNGCGKSNVSDAIKWVLGEQSPRELRGLKMEDIIFNGTSLKEAVNFAEVSLTLSNEAKVLPIEYEEITISRRLFRSGESEYLLNKTPVRLRDIQELFMGTGIGISAYSLLEQGKMDLILSSRAEDRRFIFEEAAGITKFKSQKRETLRRLDDTENNLLRVNDILVEVKRQISSIERQANKAERYKEIANVARDKEIKINKHSYLELKNQLKELEIERNLFKSQEDKLVLEQIELESRIREGRDSLNNIEQEISNLHSSEISLNSDLEKNQNRISLNKERIKELEERKGSLEGEIKTLADKISTDSNELNNIRIQAEDFIKSEESRKIVLRDKRNFINSIEAQLKEKESLVSGSKVKLISAVQDISRTKNDLVKIKTENASLLARLRRLESEKEKTANEKAKFLDTFTQRKDYLEKKRIDLEKLIEKTDTLRGNLAQLNNESSNLTERFHQTDVELQTLSSRISFLEELKSRYEGYSPGVKSLLMAKNSGQLKTEGLIDILANIIEVDRGYERIVETALGDYVQALIVRDYQALGTCIGYINSMGLGEVVFIVAENLSNSGNPGVSFTQEANYLTDFVHASDQYTNIIMSLLGRFVLVDDLDSAIALAKQNSQLKFITSKGEIVEANITKTASSSSNDDLNIIGREKRIKELRDKLASLELERNDALNKKNSVNADLDILTEELRQADKNREVFQIEAGGLEQEMDNLGKSLKKLEDEFSILDLEIAELNENIQGNNNKIKENEASLAKLQLDESEISKLMEDSANFVSENNNLRQSALIEITELESELKSFTDKVSVFKERILSFENSLSENKNMFASRESEIKESVDKVNKLHEENNSLDKFNFGIEEEKSVVIQRLDESKCARDNCKLDIEKEEGGLKSIQVQVNKLRADTYEIDIKCQEFNFKTKDIHDKMNSLYKLDLETGEIDLVVDIFDYEATKQELDSLKDKLEAMGPVNLVAIDEHRELQERYNFLVNQQEDLNKAKEALREAINKINRTAKELFVDTFQRIEVNFKEIFRLLFGGGNAQILLVESEDVLESGIDIIAQPPGKKLQNISLLSGGEKALTAVALLFAIFKVKPSPFCILDEVDAPLDEANIDRFRMLMKEFSKSSQFIVITHNKKTISIADVMYGITMEESGVSKIVSVKFAESGESSKVKSS